MVAQCRDSCREITGATEARPIRSVGIVGAGIMGAAIAIEHAARSIPVVLMDQRPEALRGAAALAARAGVQSTARQPIVYTLDEADLGGCDLVLESIVEKRQAKQALYAHICPRLARHAILTTNTSTIPIARLAAGLSDPGRFCGLHFCHPVSARPLVEVIPGPATNAETLAAVFSHAMCLGKLPLVVADGPGFVVNRLLLTYLNEALAMVARGIPAQQIDMAMTGFGMPLGPFELLDEIGLDTALQSGVVMGELFKERSPGIELLVRLVKAEQYGMKTGAGIYRYPGKEPNPKCNATIAELQTAPPLSGCNMPTHAVIVERLLNPMVVEAARVLQERKVAAAWQIDLAMIFGLGFPLWRGGLLWWAGKPSVS
jgi:3-hydroxyacyl-CoA dehydrogenase